MFFVCFGWGPFKSTFLATPCEARQTHAVLLLWRPRRESDIPCGTSGLAFVSLATVQQAPAPVPTSGRHLSLMCCTGLLRYGSWYGAAAQHLSPALLEQAHPQQKQCSQTALQAIGKPPRDSGESVTGLPWAFARTHLHPYYGGSAPPRCPLFCHHSWVWGRPVALCYRWMRGRPVSRTHSLGLPAWQCRTRTSAWSGEHRLSDAPASGRPASDNSPTSCLWLRPICRTHAPTAWYPAPGWPFTEHRGHH